jgi:hypothetical protein
MTHGTRIRSLAAAAAALLVAGAEARGGCLAASARWTNAAFDAQSRPFGAAFDAVPSAGKMDGETFLSLGAASGFAGAAVTVRFNDAGYIDARDGRAYAAESRIPYVAGARYRFRLSINPAARTYSAYVTPPGSPELTLATNYAFRAGPAPVSSLDHWGLHADSGSHRVCGFKTTAP